MEIQRIGNIYGDEFGTGYAGNVFLADGLSPTLTNMQGGADNHTLWKLNA